jgi:hypothetical protein
MIRTVTGDEEAAQSGGRRPNAGDLIDHHTATAAKTKTVMIIVTPTAGRPGQYDARVQDGCVIVQASRQPFLDAARALIKRGADPSITLEMWHDRAAHYALRAQLAHAAKLAVEERNIGGKPPRFVRYRALNRAAVATRIAPKRQT